MTRLGMDYDLRDLEAVRQHFGLGRISLVGWSYLGGMIMVYAMKHPERVNRLVQIGPISIWRDPGCDQPPPADQEPNPAEVERLEQMRQAGLNTRDPVAYCRGWYKINLRPRVGDPSALARIQFPCGLPNEWPDNMSKSFDRLIASLGKWDWRPGVASLTAPTLVINGSQDFIESAREWARTLPDARLFVVPGAGHFPFVERPDMFFPAAERFLSGEWPEGAEVVRGTDQGPKDKRNN